MVAKPLTAAEARVMARAVPLDADTIDFMRIGNFFDLYRHVLDTHGDPRKCEVQAIMAKADKAMKGLSELTASGQRTFNLDFACTARDEDVLARCARENISGI